jgi:hypothetical protein
MTSGGTITLSATLTPSNATNKVVAWSSDNAAVAAVNSSTGAVTAGTTGTARITVTTDDGKRTASTLVTVVKATVSTLPLTQSILPIESVVFDRYSNNLYASLTAFFAVVYKITPQGTVEDLNPIGGLLTSR